MEIISFFVYFGFMPNNIEYQNISFSENIDYCVNIIHNPNLEKEFYLNCDLEETNKYMMMVKN
jgi:Fe2+ transport system protein B